MEDTTTGQFQFIDCSLFTTPENNPQVTGSGNSSFQPNEINPLEFVTKEEIKEQYILKVEDFKVDNMEDQSSSTLQPYSITKSEFEAIKEEVLEPTDHMECDSFGVNVLQVTGSGNSTFQPNKINPLEFVTKEEIKEQYFWKVEDFKVDNREAEGDWCDPISDPLKMSPKPEYKTELLKTDPEKYETPKVEGVWCDEYPDSDPIGTSPKPEGEVDPLKTDPEEYETSQVEDSVKGFRIMKTTTRHKGSYKCEISNKLLSRRDDLATHQAAVHSGLKRHVCDTCKKSFSQKSSLTRHLATVHSGLKPHVCVTCKKSFGHKFSLTTHLAAVHSGIKPHVCVTCKKSFGEKNSLTKHLATVHSGLKPYVCDNCKKSFGHKCHLTTHIATVHSGLKPHVCVTCKKSFSTKCSLTRHLATVHSGLKPYV